MNGQSSRFLPWLSVLCFGLLAAIEVERVVSQGIRGGILTALLLAALFISCMFAFFDFRDFLRLRAMRSEDPAAFVSHVVIYPELISQLNQLAAIAGDSPVKIRPGRHGTIVLDASTFGLFGGYAKPKRLFSISGVHLCEARITRTQQGLWKLQCLELEYKVAQRTAIIDLSLMQVRFGLPRVVSGKILETILPAVTGFTIVEKKLNDRPFEPPEAYAPPGA